MWGNSEWGGVVKSPPRKEEVKIEKPKGRSSVYVLENSQKYLYRRAFSEVKILELMKYEKMENGKVYHFLTGGDIDCLSFFKVVLNQLKKIDYMLFSTWCMSGEDIYQLGDWIRNGVISKCDAYLGEIFKSSYPKEYRLLNDIWGELKCGRVCFFKNHSKIISGWSGDTFFTIESSANINTNPRTEQAVITFDKGLALFMKEYFDGVKSFEKET